MALNFPLNPSDGDTYQGYVYDATDGVWNANQGQIVSRFSTNATQPDSPSAGDGWFNPANGKTYIYYDGAWVESGNPVIGGVEPYDKTTSATGYFALPKGTTAQRPDTPQNGDIRFNTETGEPEWYSDNISQWINFRSSPLSEIQYLVVAGGGGGGGWVGGGGGAGGYRSSVFGELSGQLSVSESTISFSQETSFSVSIGAGGAGAMAAPGPVLSVVGTNGGDSVFGPITSLGGGLGSTWTLQAGASGGSGGGYHDGDIATSGSTGQGFGGGDDNAATSYPGGGGGGAGAVGQAGSDSYGGGDGGNGISSSITGSAIYRAGGGGGGLNSPISGTTPGSGGLGGGGNGTARDDGATTASSGVANTGGGGGGDGEAGPSYLSRGGNGGSGIVIIKYPSSKSISVGPGLTHVTNTIGDHKVTQFTAGTDTVTIS